jgi:hypothetical protein
MRPGTRRGFRLAGLVSAVITGGTIILTVALVLGVMFALAFFSWVSI